jgi:hypothetical protein
MPLMARIRDPAEPFRPDTAGALRRAEVKSHVVRFELTNLLLASCAGGMPGPSGSRRTRHQKRRPCLFVGVPHLALVGHQRHDDARHGQRKTKVGHYSGGKRHPVPSSAPRQQPAASSSKDHRRDQQTDVGHKTGENQDGVSVPDEVSTANSVVARMAHPLAASAVLAPMVTTADSGTEFMLVTGGPAGARHGLAGRRKCLA